MLAHGIQLLQSFVNCQFVFPWESRGLVTGQTTFSITIKHPLSWESYRLALATAQHGEPWETGSGLRPLLPESMTSLLHSQRRACHSIRSGGGYSSLCVKSVSSLKKEMESYQTPRSVLKLATLQIQSQPVWTSDRECASDLQHRQGIAPAPVAISSQWSLLLHYAVGIDQLLKLPLAGKWIPPTLPIPHTLLVPPHHHHHHHAQISLELDCLVCRWVEVNFTPLIYY